MGVLLHQYLPVAVLQLFSVVFCIAQATGSNSIAQALSTLVSEPQSTLTTLSALLLIPQAWFGNWCRRQYASSTAPAQRGKTKPKVSTKDLARGVRQGKLPPLSAPNLDFMARAATLTPVSIAVLHFIIVMLGAPVLTHTAETALLSCLISVLALLPAFIAVPSNEPFAYTRLVASFSSLDDVQTVLVWPAIATFAGAYVGSFAIPLDWDRPWQKWPVTCVLGALAGHATGTLAAILKLSFFAGAHAPQTSAEAQKKAQ